LKYIQDPDFNCNFFWESYLRPAWELKRGYLKNYSSNYELVRISDILDDIGLKFHRLCGSGGGGFIFIKARSKIEVKSLKQNFPREHLIPVSIDTLGSKTTVLES